MANKENIAAILLQKQVSHSHNCSLPNSLKNYPFLDANSSNLFPLTQKDDYQNKDPPPLKEWQWYLYSGYGQQ